MMIGGIMRLLVFSASAIACSVGLAVAINPTWFGILSFALPAGVTVGIGTAFANIYLKKNAPGIGTVFNAFISSAIIGFLGLLLGWILGGSTLWSIVLIAIPVSVISLSASVGYGIVCGICILFRFLLSDNSANCSRNGASQKRRGDLS
jgi:hypothetical protein